MGILHLELSAGRAKAVARLLANDTARRIMDAAADDSKSETELAKELSLPLSTVHYNVQKLQEAGLLSSDEYTYSEKGKEVRHYKVASDHVVITTKPMTGIPSIVGGTALALGVAATAFFSRRPVSAPPVEESMRMFAMDAAGSEAAMMAPDAAMAVAAEPTVWPWILAGAAAMLVGILIVALVQRYRA